MWRKSRNIFQQKMEELGSVPRRQNYRGMSAVMKVMVMKVCWTWREKLDGERL